MDGDNDFVSFSQELGFFSEEEPALNAAPPGLSYELLHEGLVSLFYPQPAGNFYSSLPPSEVNIYSIDSIPLDSKSCSSRPITQDQVWTGECADWDLERSTWSIGTQASGRSSRQRLACHYPGCTPTPFRTTCDRKIHLKDHLHEILSHWMDGHSQSCKWPGCLSKAMFKSKKALQTHVENIHVDPLLCPEKGCLYRSPFRNNFDLKRHVKTIHHDEKVLQFQCPFLECGEFPRTFVRKDKWLNHLRSGHNDSACPLSHCEVEPTGIQSKLVEHIKNFHGNFECGIGACGRQPLSRFAKFELMKHLEFHHGFENEDLDTAQNIANQASDRTVRSKDLPRDMIWRDCEVCLRKSGTQEREKDRTAVICLD